MNTATRESWIRLRKLVKRRDKATCFYCGQIDENGHCDHIIPLSKGGTDSILNLVWSCEKCNLKKSNRLIKEDSKRNEVIELEEDTILQRIIKKLFVSPLPEYSSKEYHSFMSYFELIILIRKLKLYSLIHDIIWPISKTTNEIIKSAELFISCERYFRQQEKHRKFTKIDVKCPECQCSITYKFFLDKTIKWLCPAGHYGDSRAMSTDEVIEYKKIEIADSLQIALIDKLH